MFIAQEVLYLVEGAHNEEEFDEDCRRSAAGHIAATAGRGGLCRQAAGAPIIVTNPEPGVRGRPRPGRNPSHRRNYWTPLLIRRVRWRMTGGREHTRHSSINRDGTGTLSYWGAASYPVVSVSRMRR